MKRVSGGQTFAGAFAGVDAAGIAIPGVDDGTADAPLGQRLVEISLRHHLAARDVEEHRLRPHAREPRGVDEPARLGAERAGDDHVVHRGEHVVERRHRVDAIGTAARLPGRARARAHAHAERAQPLGRCPCDVPVADEADLLAVELAVQRRVVDEASEPEAAAQLRVHARESDLPLEHAEHEILGDADLVLVDVAHRGVRGQRIEIDAIEPGAGQLQQTQARRRRHVRGPRHGDVRVGLTEQARQRLLAVAGMPGDDLPGGRGGALADPEAGTQQLDARLVERALDQHAKACARRRHQSGRAAGVPPPSSMTAKSPPWTRSATLSGSAVRARASTASAWSSARSCGR